MSDSRKDEPNEELFGMVVAVFGVFVAAMVAVVWAGWALVGFALGALAALTVYLTKTELPRLHVALGGALAVALMACLWLTGLAGGWLTDFDRDLRTKPLRQQRAERLAAHRDARQYETEYQAPDKRHAYLNPAEWNWGKGLSASWPELSALALLTAVMVFGAAYLGPVQITRRRKARAAEAAAPPTRGFT